MELQLLLLLDNTVVVGEPIGLENGCYSVIFQQRAQISLEIRNFLKGQVEVTAVDGLAVWEVVAELNVEKG